MKLQDCGHESAGGFARTNDGATMCYECADSMQAAQVANAAAGDVFIGYLSNDCRNVTTWSGGVLMSNVSMGKRHPWSHDRHYLRATDVDGRVWSGTGAAGEWATLRLTRQSVTR